MLCDRVWLHSENHICKDRIKMSYDAVKLSCWLQVHMWLSSKVKLPSLVAYSKNYYLDLKIGHFRWRQTSIFHSLCNYGKLNGRNVLFMFPVWEVDTGHVENRNALIALSLSRGTLLIALYLPLLLFVFLFAQGSPNRNESQSMERTMKILTLASSQGFSERWQLDLEHSRSWSCVCATVHSVQSCSCQHLEQGMLQLLAAGRATLDCCVTGVTFLFGWRRKFVCCCSVLLIGSNN